jgi:hypothetical protein
VKQKYGALAEEFLKLHPASSDHEAGPASSAAARDGSRISSFLVATVWQKAAKSRLFTYFTSFLALMRIWVSSTSSGNFSRMLLCTAITSNALSPSQARSRLSIAGNCSWTGRIMGRQLVERRIARIADVNRHVPCS